MKNLFTSENLEDIFKKNKLAFVCAFSIGVLISIIPYINKLIEDLKVERLIEKERQKVSLIFISSIFKRNKNYLGTYNFKSLKNLTKKDVVCLGGISKYNIKKVSRLNCFGIAGISYFE